MDDIFRAFTPPPWPPPSGREAVIVWSLPPATWLTAAVSLSVHVFTRDGSGELTFPGESPDTPTAAGFESWRIEVWGSPRVRALGAEFFPQLAGGDLYVEPAQVASFQRDCALLREHLGAIAAGVDLSTQKGHLTVAPGTGRLTDPSASREVFRAEISVRLAIIEDAADRALKADAGVLIW
jgi:hypothetical protein